MGLFSLRVTRRSAVVAALAGLAFVGCTDFSSPPAQLGHLIVNAKDESGTALAGINFTALLADRSTEWAKVTTGTTGSAEFRASDGGILPQTYIVRFDAQNAGYALATGETNDKPIQVVLGQTQTVNFTVKKTTPGGGPGV